MLKGYRTLQDKSLELTLPCCIHTDYRCVQAISSCIIFTCMRKTFRCHHTAQQLKDCLGLSCTAFKERKRRLDATHQYRHTECCNVTVVLTVDPVLIFRNRGQDSLDCIVRKLKQVFISLPFHLHNRRSLDNLSKLA